MPFIGFLCYTLPGMISYNIYWGKGRVFIVFAYIENHPDKLKVERLYDDYKQLMFHAAYEILKDQQLAEDAVHQAFLRIMKNLHKINEENRPRTRNYLVIICRNVAIDMYNQKSPLHVQEESLEMVGDTNQTNPMDIVIAKESAKIVTDAIIQLDPLYRDVLLLQRVYHKTREEIAQELGISVEAVKKRLSRGKAMILESLKKEGL